MAEQERSENPPTFYQRQGIKRLAKQSRKRGAEPMSEENWRAYFEFGAQPSSRAMKSFLRALPSSPRCGYCGAPFGGFGGRIVRPLGYRPSAKNPNICAVCVELAPPGGMTTEAGVLFADIRGFTTLSEQIGPQQAGQTLRTFYAMAEKAFLPKAMIDKVVGDEVMALYIPMIAVPDAPWDMNDDSRRAIATLMVEHARDLLTHVGYGTPEGPLFEVGVGLDFGEVFMGHVGEGAVHDFTAIGDVVNTASRLQSHTAGGEVLVSARLSQWIETPQGDPESLDLKGKQAPFEARRIRWFAAAR